MNMKSTGLKSIAYELKISINTVSRALRDCDDISEATKEKVRQKAYELGYIPNNVSQFIKRDGKQLIAVVVNSFKNMYFSIVCEKLVNILSDEDYDFTIVYSSSKRLELDVLKQCISQRVDGIITLLEPSDEVIENSKLNNIPLVIVGRQINKDFIDEVYIDDELGGQLAANYLSNFHKIKKFIYVKMPNVECSKRRQKSFQQTLETLSKENECIILDSKQIKGHLINLINQGYLGIFCFNDEIAYEVLKILNKEIPNVRKVYPRMHIIGFDCLSTRLCGLMDLTSIDYDYDEICQTAFNLLVEKMKDMKREKKAIKFTVKLHQRKYL